MSPRARRVIVSQPICCTNFDIACFNIASDVVTHLLPIHTSLINIASDVWMLISDVWIGNNVKRSIKQFRYKDYPSVSHPFCSECNYNQCKRGMIYNWQWETISYFEGYRPYKSSVLCLTICQQSVRSIEMLPSRRIANRNNCNCHTRRSFKDQYNHTFPQSLRGHFNL